MHAVIIAVVAASGVFVHLSGMVAVIAAPFGQVGTILTTVDTAVADVTGVRRYIAAQKAKNALKAVPIKMVVIPPVKAKK